MTNPFHIETACRSCSSGRLVPILSLGATPLADRLIDQSSLASEDLRVPLDLMLCEACSLVQISATVLPEILFGGDYPYFSSVSETLLAHSRTNALELIERKRLNEHSLVVEIASNDGYMLRNFKAASIPVLGIDPAKDPVATANRIGVNSLHAFFTKDLAADLAGQGQKADLIIANNVLAHVADLNGTVAGIAIMLKDDGIAVLEMPYLVDLIDHTEFDTIYHQHLCYFSVTALDHLFRSHRLVLQDIRRLPIHGGSLRLYVGRHDQQSEAVRERLAAERARDLGLAVAYQDFATRVDGVRAELTQMLSDAKSHGQRLAGYGAAAKATTLLAYCGIGKEQLDYIVDRNAYKHGRYMPGSRLPIHATERLLADRPDAVLLLTWNFAEEIMKQQARYIEGGGRFILPIPRPHYADPGKVRVLATMGSS